MTTLNANVIPLREDQQETKFFADFKSSTPMWPIFKIMLKFGCVQIVTILALSTLLGFNADALGIFFIALLPLIDQFAIKESIEKQCVSSYCSISAVLGILSVASFENELFIMLRLLLVPAYFALANIQLKYVNKSLHIEDEKEQQRTKSVGFRIAVILHCFLNIAIFSAMSPIQF